MNSTDGIVIIGLTGQSGSGKTTVSSLLRSDGFDVIDCDVAARAVVKEPGFLVEIEKLIPGCVCGGVMNRSMVATAVFNSGEMMKKYSALIFPYITYRIFSEIRNIKECGKRVVVLDAPTLFESGIDCLCDGVISVVAPLELKIKRILERDGIPIEMCISRLNSQKDELFFEQRSDWVINNAGRKDELDSSVRAVEQSIRMRFDV